MAASSDLLDADAVADGLADLPQWSGDTSSIERQVELPSFPAAIAVVDEVAEIAEEMDHHPDIDIRWRTLTFRNATHTAGGVTELDLQLARRIDAAIEQAGG
jgi:4a-hydroxytetrahydrobiopterin dehydratase